MKSIITKAGQSLFDEIRHEDEQGTEYWLSRELAKALSYSDYRNFVSVINKAMEACLNSGGTIENHFGDVTEMVFYCSPTIQTCLHSLVYDGYEVAVIRIAEGLG